MRPAVAERIFEAGWLAGRTLSHQLPEEEEQPAREQSRSRQREYPRHGDIADGRQLQPALIRRHGSRHARTEHVRCRNRQPE